MSNEKIKVVLLEPGKQARTAKIDASLAGMQQVVGGYIETAHFFDEPVCLVCNEEGKISKLPLNRAIYGNDKKILDIIAGTAFICDCSGESFGSLSEKQLKQYAKQFKNPERFININGDISAIPIKPQQYER